MVEASAPSSSRFFLVDLSGGRVCASSPMERPLCAAMIPASSCCTCASATSARTWAPCRALRTVPPAISHSWRAPWGDIPHRHPRRLGHGQHLSASLHGLQHPPISWRQQWPAKEVRLHLLCQQRNDSVSCHFLGSFSVPASASLLQPLRLGSQAVSDSMADGWPQLPSLRMPRWQIELQFWLRCPSASAHLLPPPMCDCFPLSNGRRTYRGT